MIWTPLIMSEMSPFSKSAMASASYFSMADESFRHFLISGRSFSPIRPSITPARKFSTSAGPMPKELVSTGVETDVKVSAFSTAFCY